MPLLSPNWKWQSTDRNSVFALFCTCSRLVLRKNRTSEDNWFRVLTGHLPFLSPNQQYQSTKGNSKPASENHPLDLVLPWSNDWHLSILMDSWNISKSHRQIILFFHTLYFSTLLVHNEVRWSMILVFELLRFKFCGLSKKRHRILQKKLPLTFHTYLSQLSF